MYETDNCKNAVKMMTEQPPINLFFTRRQVEPHAPTVELTAVQKDLKRQALQTRCVGLNDDSWPRAKATYRIQDCIKNSPSRYHGGPRRDILCKSMFQGRSENTLDPEEKVRLTQAPHSLATWCIKRDTAIKSIFSVKCLQLIPTIKGVEHPI